MSLSRALRPLWLALAALLALSGREAEANPTLVVDADSGAVLYQEMATAPWFPASLTKLMTTYVALSKIREGKISPDTPLRVSVRAASMAPSKMGFRPGTLVTLDNALKMLMVKSPNDVAVTIAEGLSGSVEAFADEMNQYAGRLGLRESHFVNPNGLPNPQHVSSARDMAIIGRALWREFPDQRDLFSIGALSFAGRIIPNHNNLLGRYTGADGMKTGYTCSAGYNVVASATRNGRHLITVIMGAPSVRERSEKAAMLFERYFTNSDAGSGDLSGLAPSDIVAPPDLRGTICGPGRRNAIAEAEAEDASIPLASAVSVLASPERAALVGLPALQPGQPGLPSVAASLFHPRDPVEPVRVFIGVAPGWNGPIAGPAAAPVEAAAPGPLAKPAAEGEGADGPMALVGATQSAPALAAANRAARGRSRLSLHVAAHGRAKAAPAMIEARATPAPEPGKGSKAKAKPEPKPKPKAEAKPKARAEAKSKPVKIAEPAKAKGRKPAKHKGGNR